MRLLGYPRCKNDNTPARFRGGRDDITIEFVDYCGTRDSGERVMGLAHFNPLTNSLTPDRSLIWPVPQAWSMEEAATVASSFSLGVLKSNRNCIAGSRQRVVHIPAARRVSRNPLRAQ
ncbi:hypothetical protein J6590_049727 [Homalodisca vitripennis]|nr:hypothetical protein J6590_049727 [Homalodisca vitripennis]